MAAFAVAVLAGHGWDPMALVLRRPPGIPAEQTWAVGYDGQQSYAIALDPLGPAQGLDYPAYRYLRILYPLFAHVLALGQPSLIPWAMILLNLAASGVSAGLLADLCERRGVHGGWALLVFLSFNYLIVIRFDLTEPLALAFALTGLWACERGHLPLAGAAFAAGALAREVTLAFPLSLAFVSGIRGRWKKAAYLAAVSAGVYFVWVTVVWTRLPGPRLLPLDLAPTFPPFSGLLSLQPSQSRVLVLMWAVIPAILGGVAAGWSLLRGPGAPGSESAWLVLANCGLIAVLPLASWVDPLAVLRLGLGSLVAIVLWSAKFHPRALRWELALWGPSLLMPLLIPGFIA
jgi:hypothetical protein